MNDEVGFLLHYFVGLNPYILSSKLATIDQANLTFKIHIQHIEVVFWKRLFDLSNGMNDAANIRNFFTIVLIISFLSGCSEQIVENFLVNFAAGHCSNVERDVIKAHLIIIFSKLALFNIFLWQYVFDEHGFLLRHMHPNFLQRICNVMMQSLINLLPLILSQKNRVKMRPKWPNARYSRLMHLQKVDRQNWLHHV